MSAKKQVPMMVAVPAKESGTGRDELYFEVNGKRVAKRGYPGTPQAGTWVSIEPGFEVTTKGDELVVTYNGKPVPSTKH
jgi:hypothetical protein